MGKPELAMPYMKQMMRQYRHALDFAKNVGKTPGAWFTDVYDHQGKCDIPSMSDKAVGPQVAMEMWKHWRYTGDEAFFSECAWPVMRDVSRFFASQFFLEDDGRYHIYRTSGYEGTPLYDDSALGLAMGKALFAAALEAAAKAGVEDGDTAKWRDILDRMADFTLLPLEPFELEEKDGVRVLAEGVGKGLPVEFDKVVSAGKFYKTDILEKEIPDYKNRGGLDLDDSLGYRKDTPVRTRYAISDWTPFYGVWDSELSPCYPGEVLGLADRDTDLFKAVRNQVLIHVDVHFKDKYGRDKQQINMCGGWCHYPVVMSRVGLKEVGLAQLREFVSSYQQVYVQGFGHYVPHFITQDNHDRWFTNSVGIKGERAPRVPVPAWNYRHFDYEPMPIATTSFSEMMLQSFDGVIRVFGSVPDDFEGSFRLAASGGFLVDSEMRDGRVGWFAVESLRGGTCKAVDPWRSDGKLFLTDLSTGRETEVATRRHKADEIVEFETKAGGRYLVSDRKGALEGWQVEEAVYEPNRDRKTLGFSELGVTRMF
jgi:hypothetical protein